MLSFTANDTTFHEACRTALELIEEISAVPLEYMRAMGLAMVRQIHTCILEDISFSLMLRPLSSYKNFQAWVTS